MTTVSRKLTPCIKDKFRLLYNSKLRSTAVADQSAIPLEVVLHKKEHLRKLFPWRKSTPEVLPHILNSCGFNLLLPMLVSNKNLSCTDEDISSGAEAAFASTLMAIFQHRLIKNVLLDSNKPSNVFDTDLVRSASAQQEVPSLSEIFEPRLAQFYEHAVLKFSVSSAYDIGYLHSATESSRIVRRELVLIRSSSRSSSEDCAQQRVLQLGGVSVVTDAGESVGALLRDIMSSSFAAGEVRVRYWVDICCTGGEGWTSSLLLRLTHCTPIMAQRRFLCVTRRQAR